jgi:hypothetical protein
MRILLLFSLLAFSLSATTIEFQVTTTGTTGTYEYFVSGFTAMEPCTATSPTAPAGDECSAEIDIDFDATVFSQISNGVAPAGFNLLLFQPNNPPQAPGDYSALAVVANPSLAPFSVDFTTLTSMAEPTCGSVPGQCFTINEFDDNTGLFEGVAASGVTTLVSSTVPEPASFSLIATGMIIGGIFLGFRFSVKRQWLIGRPRFN